MATRADVGRAAAGVYPPLVADAMLGRLARWLRVLGFDTAYDPAAGDRALVDRAAAESRTLLTRDRRLIAERRPHRSLLITEQAAAAQLRQVLRTLRLEPQRERLFTRCLVCNAPLQQGAEGVPPGPAPPSMAAARPAIRWCPSCGRYYWQGSHCTRMVRWLDAAGVRLVSGAGSSRP